MTMTLTGTFAPKLVRYSTCATMHIPHPETTWCENPVFHSNRYPHTEEEDQ